MTHLARDSNGNTIQAIRLGTVQTVTVNGTSAPTTNAFIAQTTIIRIVCTAACHYTVAAAPTATTSMTYLPAGVVEFVSVTAGEKIAFIQNVGAGVAYVTEGA